MTALFGTYGKRLGAAVAAAVSILAACRSAPPADAEPIHNVSPEPKRTEDRAHAPRTAVAASRPRTTSRSRDITAGYPWFDPAIDGVPAADSTLEERFPTDPGFSRVKLEIQSFGAFLRALPLAAPNTPVLSYRGDVVRSDNHPNIAAVVAIDIGNRDLQQCADAILRLHAEWRYARGHRDHVYRAANGTKLSFARYAAGERLRVDGNNLSFVAVAKPTKPTHALLRTWLDDVFSWTNTGALSRDAQRVDMADLRPGDFFVVPGVPYGHTVLVLDMAKDATGRIAVLLGQSFVPAQNVHVLRPNTTSVWFVINKSEQALTTPFWKPFPFASLRRLP